MGRYIIDTAKMRWETYVYPRSGRILFVDTLGQAAAGRSAAATVCSGEKMWTNTDR